MSSNANFQRFQLFEQGDVAPPIPPDPRHGEEPAGSSLGDPAGADARYLVDRLDGCVVQGADAGLMMLMAPPDIWQDIGP